MCDKCTLYFVRTFFLYSADIGGYFFLLYYVLPMVYYSSIYIYMQFMQPKVLFVLNCLYCMDAILCSSSLCICGTQ